MGAYGPIKKPMKGSSNFRAVLLNLCHIIKIITPNVIRSVATTIERSGGYIAIRRPQTISMIPANIIYLPSFIMLSKDDNTLSGGKSQGADRNTTKRRKDTTQNLSRRHKDLKDPEP